jgi:hypothetical protein
MTFLSSTDKSLSPSHPNILEVILTLNDSITYRSRTVYSFITLVSEVSGFADILFVIAGVFLTFFYTPAKLEVSLLEHMGPVELPTKSPKKA